LTLSLRTTVLNKMNARLSASSSTGVTAGIVRPRDATHEARGLLFVGNRWAGQRRSSATHLTPQPRRQLADALVALVHGCGQLNQESLWFGKL
jgi:hypothetical protein